MFNFDGITYINCIVESIVLLLLWTMLIRGDFPLSRYGIMFLSLCSVSIVVASIEVAQLYVNVLLLFFCGFCCFRKVGIYNAILYTLFAFLSLLYLQAILMWLFPKSFIESERGHLAINGAVLVVVILLTLLSKKFRWAEMYYNNRGTVWLFLVLLCIPGIVIMQIVVLVLVDPNYLLIFSLLMLQLCYVMALSLFFSLHARKQTRRQIQNIQDTINTLNLYLDDSKRRVHDFNKHIHFLHSVVTTQSSQPELKKIIDDYCQDMLSISEQEEIMLQLEDPTFRALLYRREMQARTLGIMFILNASTVLPMFPLRDYQLVTVFDNLLDNAFECVENLPNEKWIKVLLQTVPLDSGKTRHIFCVQNPYDEIDFSAITCQKYYTSKGGGHQGVGLQNVGQIISASGGTLLLNHDNKIFTAKVVYELAEPANALTAN